jgi:hypothetical protein
MAPSKTTADLIWDARTENFLRSCAKIEAGVELTPVQDGIRKQYWSEFEARKLLAEREITDRRMVKEIKEKRKADRRARWEARCPMLVKKLSALKKLVLMRKKSAANKPVATTKSTLDYLYRTTPQSAATRDRPWAPRTKLTSRSAYKSSPSVTPRASPGRSSS